MCFAVAVAYQPTSRESFWAMDRPPAASADRAAVGQLGNGAQIVVGDVEDEAVVGAQQADDGGWAPVAQSVGREFRGDQDDPFRNVVELVAVDEGVPRQRVVQGRAEGAEVGRTGQRPLPQLDGSR